MDNENEYLTVDEAATLLHCHNSAVYEALKRGCPGKKIGREWRISKTELQAWFRGSSQHVPSLAHAIAPEVAREVAALLAEAFANLGAQLDQHKRR